MPILLLSVSCCKKTAADGREVRGCATILDRRIVVGK